MFADDITRALPAMQARAESLMTLTLRAYAPGLSVVDGIEQPSYASMGDTLGKVQGGAQSSRDTVSRTVQIGGVVRPVLEGGLHLPVDSYVVDGVLQIVEGDQGIGWEFEVIDVAPPADPALIGRRWLVVSVPVKNFATARRLDIAEVIS